MSIRAVGGAGGGGGRGEEDDSLMKILRKRLRERLRLPAARVEG
jgi:hypothetical protein